MSYQPDESGLAETGALFALLLAALGLVILAYILMPTAAGALECKERPDGTTYWRYRIIDGERCWFKGHRVLPKSSLHWPDEPKPKKFKGDPVFNKINASLPAPPEEKPAVKDADKEDRANDPPTRRGQSSTLLNAVTWHMARPFDQAQPIIPPLNLAVPDDPDVWPDLSDFERRFVGMQP